LTTQKTPDSRVPNRLFDGAKAIYSRSKISTLLVERNGSKHGQAQASDLLRFKYRKGAKVAPPVTKPGKRSRAKRRRTPKFSGNIENLGFTEKELKLIEELHRYGTIVKTANAMGLSDSALRSALFRLRGRYLRARSFVKQYEKERRKFPPNKKFLATGVSKKWEPIESYPRRSAVEASAE
jgi:hypothetical protein